MVSGSIPTLSIAAFITCADRSTAWTFASAPSFFPLATALRTADTITTSFISISSHLRSIAQRLAGLQGVLHAFLRFLRAEQAQEGVALQIENVLFRDLPRRSIPAGEDVRQLVRDPHLVLRDLAAFLHCPHGVLQVPERVLAHGGDDPRERRRVV